MGVEIWEPRIQEMHRHFAKRIEQSDIIEWQAQLSAFDSAIVNQVFDAVLSDKSIVHCPTIPKMLYLIRQKLPQRQAQKSHDPRYPDGWRGYVEIQRAYLYAARRFDIIGWVKCRVSLDALIIDSFVCKGQTVAEVYCKLQDVLNSGAELQAECFQLAFGVEYQEAMTAKPEVRDWLQRQYAAGKSSVEILQKIGAGLAKKEREQQEQMA